MKDWESRGYAGVYFVLCTETGRVKVGITCNIAARLASLRVGSPTQLELLAVIGPADRDLENAIHAKLDSHRLHGEWFSPHQDVLDVIELYGRCGTAGYRYARTGKLVQKMRDDGHFDPVAIIDRNRPAAEMWELCVARGYVVESAPNRQTSASS